MLLRNQLVFLVVLFSTPAWCGVITDFETFQDSDVITNQIPGLIFTNTMVLTSGVSLNEFDFPPHSGTNVAFDNGGPITIVFSSPIQGFSAYFTYLDSLTVLGFNGAHVQVAGALSLFSNNTVTGGDPGSSPNELMEIKAQGISSVSITGALSGSSFTMDDVAVVPEPNSAIIMTILAGLGFQRLRRHHKVRTQL